MDSFSALSSAASIVQSRSFNSNVMSKEKHIYELGNGSLVENIDARITATRLENLTGKLRDDLKGTLGSLTEDE